MQVFILIVRAANEYRSNALSPRILHTDMPQNHHTAVWPSFWPGGASILDKKIPLLQLIILVLTVYWLLSFFGQSIVLGIPHTGRFIDMLAVVIVVLIIIKFLS